MINQKSKDKGVIANDIEIIWRRLDEFDDLPWNGTIVVIAHDEDLLRWAYLPIDASRKDVESAFSRGYRWYGPAACQGTKIADGKVIDQWHFMIEPFVQLAPAAANLSSSRRPASESLEAETQASLAMGILMPDLRQSIYSCQKVQDSTRFFAREIVQRTWHS